MPFEGPPEPGGVVTAAVVRLAPESAWLMPGLWQLFFSQGVFASCRFLPRPVCQGISL